MIFSIAKESFFISCFTIALSSVLLASGLRTAGIIFFLLFIFMLFFFRDPDRIAPDTAEVSILSPADGKIIKVESDKISIFMSLFDVHVNRSPIAGRIDTISYRKGTFKAAFLDEAGRANERNTIVVESDCGKIRCTQIAGVIARRIVCTVKEGDHVKAGERVGMIRFGSRVDLEIPKDATIIVSRGDRVKSGTSVIAVLRSLE